MTSYQMSSLDEALGNVLGHELFRTLQKGIRAKPELVRDACCQAFVYGTGSADDHYVLRLAATDLDRNGFFSDAE